MTAEHNDPLDPEPQPHGATELIDVPFDPPWVRYRAARTVVAILVLLPLIALLISRTVASGDVRPTWAMVVVATIGVVAYGQARQRRTRSRIVRALREEKHLGSAAHRVIEGLSDSNVMQGLTQFARRARLSGYAGGTVRIGPEFEFAPVPPLQVAFEPLILDESDEAFVQLAENADPGMAFRTPASAGPLDGGCGGGSEACGWARGGWRSSFCARSSPRCSSALRGGP